MPGWTVNRLEDQFKKLEARQDQLYRRRRLQATKSFKQSDMFSIRNLEYPNVVQPWTSGKAAPTSTLGKKGREADTGVGSCLRVAGEAAGEAVALAVQERCGSLQLGLRAHLQQLRERKGLSSPPVAAESVTVSDLPDKLLLLSDDAKRTTAITNQRQSYTQTIRTQQHVEATRGFVNQAPQCLQEKQLSKLAGALRKRRHVAAMQERNAREQPPQISEALQAFRLRRLVRELPFPTFDCKSRSFVDPIVFTQRRLAQQRGEVVPTLDAKLPTCHIPPTGLECLDVTTAASVRSPEGSLQGSLLEGGDSLRHRKEFYYVTVKVNPSAAEEQAAVAAWRLDVVVTDITDKRQPSHTFHNLRLHPASLAVVFHEPDGTVLSPVEDLPWVSAAARQLFGHTLRIEVVGTYPERTKVVDTTVTYASTPSLILRGQGEAAEAKGEAEVSKRVHAL